jgi:hypothetical protein
MSTNTEAVPLSDEKIEALKAAALAATPQDIDSAESIDRFEDGSHVECPACGGEGHVELEADFCNYDGTAIGVQFYGIGNAHGAAESYLRAAMPSNVLALIERLERAEATLATTPQTEGATLALTEVHGEIVSLLKRARYVRYEDLSADVRKDAETRAAYGNSSAWQDARSHEQRRLIDEVIERLAKPLAATHAPAMAETQLTADDADMVWPDDDSETFFHTIDDAVENEVSNAWPVDVEPLANGELELKLQLAKRIPTATIRIFNITENGHEWEIMPTGAAASGGELGS